MLFGFLYSECGCNIDVRCSLVRSRILCSALITEACTLSLTGWSIERASSLTIRAVLFAVSYAFPVPIRTLAVPSIALTVSLSLPSLTAFSLTLFNPLDDNLSKFFSASSCSIFGSRFVLLRKVISPLARRWKLRLVFRTSPLFFSATERSFRSMRTDGCTRPVSELTDFLILSTYLWGCAISSAIAFLAFFFSTRFSYNPIGCWLSVNVSARAFSEVGATVDLFSSPIVDFSLFSKRFSEWSLESLLTPSVLSL